jgi:hypothetical protein
MDRSDSALGRVIIPVTRIMSELLLYTIPFSHFCDLGRWSLQRANVPFTECPRLPGFHSPSVMQARFAPLNSFGFGLFLVV